MTHPKTWRFRRRAILRGAGGLALALPWLESFRPRQAHALGEPKRFAVMFSVHGFYREAWMPSGTETRFTLGKTTMPLKDHQKDLIFISGLEMPPAKRGAGDPHQKGMGVVLTNTELPPGKFGTHDTGSTRPGWAAAQSIDQRIADAIGTGTKLRSIELGVRVTDNSVLSRLNYLGKDRPLDPENDPRQAFNRLFADFKADNGADGGMRDKLRAQRRSVLDFVLADHQRARAKISTGDRRVIDAHLSSLRDTEKALFGTGAVVQATPGAGRCVAPTMDATEPRDGDKVMQAHIELLARAFACDITRVGTLMYGFPGGSTHFPFLGISDSFHKISHQSSGDAGSREATTKVNTWSATQMALFITKLKSFPEGDRTVFDNSLIWWVSELASTWVHGQDGMCFTLAGSAGGALETGRFLRYPGKAHGQLCVSLLRAMGISDPTFGDPASSAGPLIGI